MVSGRDLRVPPGARCEQCGRPVGGAEPYWVVKHPVVVHERCRDWSQSPFPYEKELRGLRRFAIELRELLKEVSNAGRRLAAQKRSWPPKTEGGALNLPARQIAEGRKALDRVRTRARRLGMGTPWIDKR